MATVSTYAPAQSRGWTITEGIVLVIVGIIALAAPVATAAFTSLILPVVLLVEGVVLIVSAFEGRSFGSAVWHVLLGIIALLAAAAVFAEPIIAVASVPVILATYLIIKGIAQLVMGASVSEGKGWIYTSGVINILLGVLVLAQPFGASLVLTGIYIGLSILMLGILLLVAGGTRRSTAAVA